MGCELRQWKKEDAESLAELLNNKKILDNLRDGLPYPYTASDALGYIDAMLNSDKNSVFAFAVVTEGKVVGSVGIFRQQNIHYKTAELGYYIGEPYWNIGIATEAVKRACCYVFENTDIIRIFAEPFARNVASCRVLEKAGFVYEGTLCANAVKCGKVEDMKMYAKIKERFQD
ncbi:MAG: GNAT family N-acetyltransferase [Clostridia bacterium]|nr:GNAT family N-acetyltransferase [Clostridia bacterium]